MSLRIYVDAYSRFRANVHRRQFCLDDDVFEITEVEDPWYEPDAMYFRVRTTEGNRYILRYNEHVDHPRVKARTPLFSW